MSPLSTATAAVRPSLTSLREFRELLRGDVRAEFRSLRVPLAGLGSIGLDTDSAKLSHKERVKGLSKHQRCSRAAGHGSALQQKPRRGEIAALQEILGARRGQTSRVPLWLVVKWPSAQLFALLRAVTNPEYNEV